MKLSNSIIILMLSSTPVMAQTDSTITDSSNLIIQKEEINFMSNRSYEGIYIIHETIIGPAGEPVQIESHRKRVCHTCGMG